MPTSKALVIFASLAAFGALAALLYVTGGKPEQAGAPKAEADGSGGAPRESIVVYCAVGLRPPVELAAKRFQAETGTQVDLDYDNSGSLLGKLKLEKAANPHGDLYIPADDSFIGLAREAELIREVLPLARFRAVLAVKPGNPKQIKALDDLLRSDVTFVICEEKAAVGRVSKQVLQQAGKFEALKAKAKSEKATVTEAAMVVQASNEVDAAFVWDSTARQFKLDIMETPELKSAAATIAASVIATSPHPTAALRFARYLCAPEKGAKIFEEKFYEPLPGDPWAVTPALTLFAGGTNRIAVEATLKAFEAREGCTLNTTFAGCGTLNGMIETGRGNPDLYLTCDASFLTKVADRFEVPEDVATTQLTILVRKEKADAIHSLEDLGKEGISLGVGDEELGALGMLTAKVLKERGLYDAVRKNVKVTSPTAHELVLQVEAHDKLDAAIVYRVNCNRIDKEKLFTLSVEGPTAVANQNVAVARNTQNHQLAERLLKQLLSLDSRAHFEVEGFKWKARPAQKP
ncbi:MAG: substrate-binding domain-containing protein [Planctomycetes bacterium]|nr:substrate-binding domain-containing protein [Planctomycetota bacterium]